MISGGYIYKFKGFGFEIETSLERLDITDVDLKAKEVMKLEKVAGKGSIEKLFRMSSSEKNKIRRLLFVHGYSNYSEYAVKTYIKELKGLKIIEIVDDANKFIAMMHVNKIIGKEKKFVESLSNNMVLNDFSNGIITDFVKSDANIIDALKIMKASKQRNLPVINNQGSMVGLVTEINLLRNIASKILDAKERSN